MNQPLIFVCCSCFPLFDLIIQNLHGRSGDQVDLLSDRADRDHGFSGNRRIVKADQEIVVRQAPVCPEEKI